MRKFRAKGVTFTVIQDEPQLCMAAADGYGIVAASGRGAIKEEAEKAVDAIRRARSAGIPVKEVPR